MKDVIVEAGRSLILHRFRTLLSGLGILFGVAAVIGILSIGEGARREQEALIAQLGILNIQFTQRDAPEDDEEAKEIKRKTRGLSRRDVDALARVLPDAVQVGGLREINQRELLPRPEDRSQVRVVGIDAAHLLGSSLHLSRGRPMRPDDAGRRVAWLAPRAQQQLFGTDDPIGRDVRVGLVWFHVVGLVDSASSGEQSISGVDIQDRSGDIIVPLSTTLEHFAVQDYDAELDEIQVTLDHVDHVVGNVEVASALMARLHREQPVYDLVVPMRLLEQSRAQQRIFNLVMGLIAGISLLVGGIGIMNIMMASVMERTREIGIRMAVGASPKNIHQLFLVESSLISLGGGALGIVAGYGISWGVSSFTGWATAVSPEAVALAAVISMTEGIIFGYVPARRAAQLQPALAVRSG